MPAKSKASSKQAPRADPPNWPPLRPLVPTSDLSLDVLTPDQIVLIRNLLTPTLCKTLVDFMCSLPLQTTPGVPKKGDAARINDRYLVEDPSFAETLWQTTALKELIAGAGNGGGDNMTAEERRRLWGGEVLGLNPNVRLYRYTEGQFFGPHYDATNTLPFPTTPTTPSKTTWTLLIYLTSPSTGCLGGETVFYPAAGNALISLSKSAMKKLPSAEPIVVRLETGMALLHKHGADCMLHEGRMVEKGEKWVLRSDICVRKEARFA